MRVCIYTAIYGDYDQLKPHPPQSLKTDFVCFTDHAVDENGWRVIIDDRMRGEHPRLRAKYFKVLSHGLFDGPYAETHGLTGYDAVIWIDGKFQITSSEFASEMLASVRRFGFAMRPHAKRDCIYDELTASLVWPKYHGLPLAEQVESYRQQGYPAHNGLMRCGIIVRLTKNPWLRHINRDWWQEIRKWSYQDQLSLPFVLWKRFYWFDEIRLDPQNNGLFLVTEHASDK